MKSLYDLNYHHLLYFWTVAHEGSVAAASSKLNLTQPTVSMQIHKLERAVGHKLFRRAGRSLVLTETGQIAYRYANEIFSVGRELTKVIAGQVPDRPSRLCVGIPDVMSKIIAYRLLEPVFAQAEPVQVECHEAKLDQLLADLAMHRYDVLLSDAPLGMGVRVKAHSHRLGSCDLAFCGTRELARKLRRRFPESLHGAPMILPTGNTELRRAADQWLDLRGLQPRLIAEIEDSALMKEFGRAGFGVFPMPSAIVADVCRRFDVVLIGTIAEIQINFFAITTERRLNNPMLKLICNAARARTFAV